MHLNFSCPAVSQLCRDREGGGERERERERKRERERWQVKSLITVAAASRLVGP